MKDDLNIQLPAGVIIKQAYLRLIENIKPFVVLSYLIAVPLFILQLLIPLGTSAAEPITTGLVVNLLASAALVLLLSIFLYRLFVLGAAQQFKITAAQLGQMFNRMLLYTLALIFVTMLAVLSVGLLFGLVVSIISAVAELGETANALLTSTVPIIIMIFFLLIVFRTQPTFISIAIDQKTIPMKSAYYYTRDNNWTLVLIGLACYVPAFLISMATIALIAIFAGSAATPSTSTMLLSLVLAPLNMASYALQLSAGAEIYKRLVPEGKENKVDISI